MKLYSWGAAPNPRRVLIYMAEKGIEIPVVEAGEGAHLTDDFLARYDGRIVPMLELDDGTQIGEAMAICRYLGGGVSGAAAVWREPAGPRDGRHVGAPRRERRLQRRGGGVPQFHPGLSTGAGRGLPGFEEPIEQIPDLVERGKKRLIARFYGRIERQLADNRFIAGPRFSVHHQPTSPRSVSSTSRPGAPRSGSSLMRTIRSRCSCSNTRSSTPLFDQRFMRT